MPRPEKLPRRMRPKDCLASAALFLRAWQLASVSIIFLSFSVLFGYIQRNKLGETARMVGIISMSRFVLAYSVLVIITVHGFQRLKLPYWHVFAKISLPGDLLMMSFFIAKITVLSIAGLPADCHGLTRENYFGDDLMRQPLDGYTTVRFGAGTRDNVGELDRLCHLPRAVYALCVVDIFSYTFSLMLTARLLYYHYRQRRDNEKVLPRGHVEEAIPLPPHPRAVSEEEDDAGSAEDRSSGDVPSTQSSQHYGRPSSEPRPSSLPSPEARRESLSETVSTTAPSRSESRPSSSTVSTPTTPTSEATATQPRPGSSRRSDAISWRTSQDTVMSAFDPDRYLVSDGFRPPAEPPAYSSRPVSLDLTK